MTDVVFIPGLGADERLFDNIRTVSCNRHFVRWHKPAPQESLQNYVQAIAKQLESLHHPVLVGVSLGGIVAMELRELFPVEKTILISSVKSKQELPSFFARVKAFRLADIFPPALLKHSTPWIRPFISGASDEANYQLFLKMLHATDDAFIRWSIQQVLHWEREAYTPGNVIHMHGTEDYVFPYRNIIHCDYSIQGGAHDMILSKAAEISDILAKEIP